MSETVLIDANNLHYHIPHLRKEKPDSSTIINVVTSRLSNSAKYIFFFDGSGNNSSNVKYSGTETADELIKKYISENHTKKKIRVVSSDSEVIRFAKAHMCEVTASDKFWHEINKKDNSKTNINELYLYDKEKPSGLSKKDLNEFKKYFS